MAKLITVQFALSDDDPAASIKGMVEELQGTLYDEEGMSGSFVVQRIEEYINDPSTFVTDEHLHHDPIPTLIDSCKTVDVFHTPETKEDMDAWIKAQASVMPTGVAVMVGFNFGMRQVQRILNGELKMEVQNNGTY